MHDALLDQVLPQANDDATASEPRLVAGIVNRVTGVGATVKVWAVIDGFEGYEWGPLEHDPFPNGSQPLVGARCAIGVFSDEKWLLAVDEVSDATLPGTILSYVEFNTPVTVNQVIGSGVTVVSAAAVAADGVEAMWVEFYAPSVTAAANDRIVVELYDGATRLGVIANVNNAGGTAAIGVPVHVKRKITPTAGSHTYVIKASRIAADGSVVASIGGAGVYFPGYVCVMSA